jgi:hypothetical protein
MPSRIDWNAFYGITVPNKKALPEVRRAFNMMNISKQ